MEPIVVALGFLHDEHFIAHNYNLKFAEKIMSLTVLILLAQFFNLSKELEIVQKIMSFKKDFFFFPVSLAQF